MNPTAGLREAWKYIAAKKAEKPQDQENYDDSPQHEISPFECFCPDDDQMAVRVIPAILAHIRPKLILRQTSPNRIHQPGNVNIRQLGEVNDTNQEADLLSGPELPNQSKKPERIDPGF
jgi:hypothetical protein